MLLLLIYALEAILWYLFLVGLLHYKIDTWLRNLKFFAPNQLEEISTPMATRSKAAAVPAPLKKSNAFNAKAFERPGLSEDVVMEIKEAFDLFDTDNGGSIDPKGDTSS